MKDPDGELLYPPRMKQAMAFHRIKKKLQREYLGKWVIIHSSQHVGGGYDNSQSAYAAAEDMGLKIQDCLIMRVVAGDTAFLAYGG